MSERRVKLGLTDRFSDKVYSMEIKEVEEDKWIVDIRYGKRINPNMKAQQPYIPTSFKEANKIYDKLLKQKLNKGYRVEEEG